MKQIFRKELNCAEIENFIFNEKNRKVNRNQVNKLKECLKEGRRFVSPIVVNSRNNHVIDGQHRLMAFKESINEGAIPAYSTIDVKFVYEDEKNEDKLICEMNSIAKKWGQADYVNFHMQSNKESYEKLNKWASSHSLTRRVSKNTVVPYLRYASAILTGKNCKDKLKNGTFTISDSDLERGNLVHDEMEKILDVMRLPKTGPHLEGMALEWNKYREKLTPIDRFIPYFKMTKTSLKTNPTGSKDWHLIFCSTLAESQMK